MACNGNKLQTLQTRGMRINRSTIEAVATVSHYQYNKNPSDKSDKFYSLTCALSNGVALGF